MPNPNKYARDANFTLGVSGTALNAELDAVAGAAGATIDALLDIRRPDGKLNNGIVLEESLAPGLLLTLRSGLPGLPGPPGPTDYNLLTNKPATFPPSVHTHPQSDVVGLADALLARAPAVHAHTVSQVSDFQSAALTGPETGTTVTTKAATDFAFYIGLGTAYVPRPSGDMNADTPAIAAALAKNVRFTELQPGLYLLNNQGVLTPNSNQFLIGSGKGVTTLRAMAAAAAGRSLYRATSKNNIGFFHLTWDANNLLPTENVGHLAFTLCNDLHMDHFELLHLVKFGLAINAAVNITMGDDWLITKDAVSALQNQAINISNFSGPVTNVKIGAGKCVGSAITVSGTHGRFLGTTVESFAFGAGFYTQNPVVSGTACEHWEVLYCKVSEGLGHDENETSSEGIENWAAHSQLVGNELWNLAGTGILNGAQRVRINYNTIWNTGRDVAPALNLGVPAHTIGAPGITLFHGTGANTSSNSTLRGNTVFDDQPTRTTGTSTAAFGRELGALYAYAGLTGVAITEDNDFGDLPVTIKSEGVFYGRNPQIRADSYYSLTEPGATSASPVSAADLIFFVPFDVEETVPVSSLSLQVTTGGAASAFKIAVYASGPTGRPTGAPVLVNNTGVATTAAGPALATVTGKLRRRAPYWYAVKFTGTLPSVVGFTQTTYGGSRRIGRDVLGGTAILARTLAAAYADPMPTLTGSEVLAESAALGIPLVHLRKA